MFHCPMCMGFHAGWVLMLLPNTLFSFGVSVTNGFVLACVSSGTSYLLCMGVQDGGIRLDA
jgi:hypothetical protein